jgi:hypothetical protein
MWAHKFHVSFGILLFVLFATQKPEQPPSTLWGCWTITKMLPTAGVSGLSPERVKAIIGTHLVLTPSCARSGRAVVSSPAYATSVLSDREFFELGYIPLSQIGIHQKRVTRVRLLNPELSNIDFAGADVFLRKTDIVIEVENDYFVAKRVKFDDGVCNCEAPEGNKE